MGLPSARCLEGRVLGLPLPVLAAEVEEKSEAECWSRPGSGKEGGPVSINMGPAGLMAANPLALWNLPLASSLARAMEEGH